MAAVAAWIPEDDLLLKNAVEAGASLEALAKGAVRFSRKFTVRELRDRWHSLLYNPEISSEASARMVEYELSASTDSKNKSVQFPAKKRKLESVRELYYAMRKRFRDESFESFELVLNGNGTNDDDKKVVYEGSCMIGDGVEDRFRFQNAAWVDNGRLRPVGDEKNGVLKDASNLGDSLGEFGNGEELGPSYACPDMPIWKTIEDVSAPAMPINMSIERGDKDQGVAETLMCPDNADGDVGNSGTVLKDRHAGDLMISSSAATSEGDFVDRLLSLANEDELMFVDEDGKDNVGKSCCDNINSLLLSSPSKVHEDVDVADVCEIQTPALNTRPAVSDGACTSELGVIADPSHSGHGDQLSVCPSQVDLSASTSVPDPITLELHDGELHCTLNTEDLEIPSNDDICLPVIQTNYRDANNPSSSGHQKNVEQEVSLKKNDAPTLSFPASRLVGSGTLPETSPKHPIVGFGVKAELSHGSHLDVDSKDFVHVDPRQGRLAHATPKLAMDGALKIEETDAPGLVGEHAMLHAETGYNKKFLEPDPTVDQEESEDDDDIPCFSDIETMILQMDLCPDDQDLYSSREVSRYQHEETKRTIIRLEQCARSSMQRAIASQGALAILYGRHLKQYIKKTEVILGRATKDTAVDIDLGREGHAGKVSRRQALIKMKEDGSFFLKNLGRSSIFLNGKEVGRGQLLNLNSGSLIEIREMAFVFEMNHISVRQHLAKVVKKSQEKCTKFEWSPERGCQ
ncbi:hypothetical protein CMV_008557 [Castanea mollissima]|uniref:FHA domain-containing protein n=1 Tax=Castanea mollissima TaxID=60419 RepID=A0A8J4RFY9_9ROSI|nr:hypothetical protein CMV_008557 [Castanea mollissima]